MKTCEVLQLSEDIYGVNGINYTTLIGQTNEMMVGNHSPGLVCGVFLCTLQYFGHNLNDDANYPD